MTLRTLHLLPLLAVLLVGTTACAQSGMTSDRNPAMAITADAQTSMTPMEVLESLKDGNQRFVTGQTLGHDYMAQVAQTGSGQFPVAAILGCIDSRVPHELIFDTGIGDIFSARIAGNFVNTDILGSFEFATAAAGAKVIVVVGHTECGAVKGTCDHVELGNLTSTLANIAPAVYAVGDMVAGERSSSNAEFVQAVADENVELTVRNMVERSAVMSGLVAEGKLIVIGAMHDVRTGVVTFMDDSMITAETL